MSKWSNDKLKSRYEQVSLRRPNGVYAGILRAEMARRGLV